jgi:hypothetical protein
MPINLNTGTTGGRKKIFTAEEVGERMWKFRNQIGGIVDLTKWVVSAEYIDGATIYKNIDTGAVVSLNVEESRPNQ